MKPKKIEIEIYQTNKSGWMNAYPTKVNGYRYRNHFFKTIRELEVHKANIEYYKRNPMGRSFAGYGHIKPYSFCHKCSNYHPKKERCK